MSAPASDLRVMVLDTWEELPLTLPPDATAADLKRLALSRSRVRRAPEEYEVKYNGARLDEQAPLRLPPNASVIVLPRGRRPAR